ncbi:MAG: helicase-associated domain-containing protein, partial [Pseudomonadota bacterium]|nr:helicase-associated domain-containing protein [Pseudomonadota bacterium]
MKPDNPLIVQSDYTLLLELHAPLADAAREAIAPFTELVKSPEHIHTYRITPLSVWNACSAGLTTAAMIATLHHYAKYAVALSIDQEIESLGQRYGLTVIERDEASLQLCTANAALAELLQRDKHVSPYLGQRLSATVFRIDLSVRGVLKQALVNIGYPPKDLAGYVEGDRLAIQLRDYTLAGLPFILRHYQREAVANFYQAGQVQGGNGVIVLPCGAGKTIVGMMVMAEIQEQTLILTTGQTAIHQWQQELLDKT